MQTFCPGDTYETGDVLSSDDSSSLTKPCSKRTAAKVASCRLVKHIYKAEETVNYSCKKQLKKKGGES